MMFPAFCIGQTAEDYFNKAYNASEKLLQFKIDNYTKAINLNPDYSAAFNNRGFAKYSLNDYDGAIADYTKAIELDT